MDLREVQGDADPLAGLRPPPDPMVQRHGPGVGPEQVVGHLQGPAGILPAGGMQARQVAVHGGPARLVQGGPQLDPVAEVPEAQLGILQPGFQGLGVLPALQGQRQIPVVQRHVGGDPLLEQRIHEPVVEVQSGLVDGAPPLGQQPGPGQREAVARVAQAPHPADVLSPTVVVVAGHFGMAALVDPFRKAPAEVIPNRRALAVQVGGPLDLQGGGGRPPDETRWKAAGLDHAGELAGLRGDSSRRGPPPPRAPARFPGTSCKT